MLQRIHFDNFRCFVNFEYKPGQKQLQLGGKRQRQVIAAGCDATGEDIAERIRGPVSRYNLSVQDRLNQFAKELQQSEGERLRPCLVNNKEIAHLAPEGSVETRLVFQNDEAVDEVTEDKATNQDWDKLIGPSAVRPGQRTTKDNPSQDCFPSLAYGIRELRELAFED
jgi:hypothetical protein